MENIDKLSAILEKRGIDICVISSQENLVYSTGYDLPPPLSADKAFAEGLPLAFSILDVSERKVKLVIQSGLAPSVKKDPAMEIYTWDIYDHFKPYSLYNNFTKAVDLAFGAVKKPIKTIGIEPNTVPQILLDIASKHSSGGGKEILNNVSQDLFAARKIKSDAELAFLSLSAKAADAAQEMLNQCSASYGMTDYEVWFKCLEAASKVCGSPAVVSGELVTGANTRAVNYPGGPKGITIQKGDAGIMDFSVRLNGYWCDCCNVVVFGDKATEHQKHYFDTTEAAFDAAVKAIKPGTKCSEVFKAAEKAYEKHGEKVPHYIGHQIGCTVNENPRIVPYDDTIIEQNMVFSLEPGCYEGGQGVTGSRTEKMVYVTASGCEVFNKFKWGA